jgi:glycosyltransferase involved in cell wall biosynthesis
MRSVRVGILSREFFDRGLGRMGGFGYAARAVATTLQALAPAVEPILLSGAAPGPDGLLDTRLGATAVVFGSGHRARDAWRWRRLRLDALLTIDWHSSFLPVTRALPRTPVLLWSRDPRGPDEWDTIAGLRLPGGGGDGLEPTGAVHDGGPARLVEQSQRWRRAVRILLTDELLADRFEARFGLPASDATILGTPVDADLGGDGLGEVVWPEALSPELPYAVFLGRLDPIKRPWIFAALAAEVPEMHFVVLGQQHLHKGWRPTPAPNLHWLGHVDGRTKTALLAGAVATVNTSIHEAIPLSLLESLHEQTPVVACLELGGLPARFGISVEPVGGDGLAAVPPLARAVRGLLADPPRRAALGAAGQAWVEARHSRDAFGRALGFALVDVGCPAPWIAVAR